VKGINSNLLIIYIGETVGFIEEHIFFSPKYTKVLDKFEKRSVVTKHML